MVTRRKTKTIKIGNLRIGGNNPIAIQSMSKFKTSDTQKTISQIKDLETMGCEIIRVAVRDSADAKAIKKIKKDINIPLAADIHFNWKLAIEAIDNGADKIRLNPGNIYKENEIKEVVSALKQAKIPLRIGVNSGSVRDTNSKNMVMPDKLVAACLDYVKTIEKFGYFNLVISLKASNVPDTIAAYRRLCGLCAYPLHLGVTAAGANLSGVIKSSIAIGSLLLEGIGDTIRVSLTDKPQEEIRAAKFILEALGLRNFNPQIISCPTCGRCEVDVVSLAKKLETRLSSFVSRPSSSPPTIALMGCVVNGPGEAREADIGVAFGKKEGLLFKKGKPIRKVHPGKCIDILINEISNW